jgi:hypothetical protein
MNLVMIKQKRTIEDGAFNGKKKIRRRLITLIIFNSQKIVSSKISTTSRLFLQLLHVSQVAREFHALMEHEEFTA